MPQKMLPGDMVVWNTGLSHVHLICRVSIAEGSSGPPPPPLSRGDGEAKRFPL
jgi:hypothetical protein